MKKETYGLYRELIGNAIAHLDDLISLRKISRTILLDLKKEAETGASPEEKIRESVLMEKCAWMVEMRMKESISLIRDLFDRDVTDILRCHAKKSGDDYDSFVKGEIQL